LLNTIENKKLNDDIRTELKGFYGVLKSNDQYLRFTMLTGITKFSQVSIFSDLNHLIDISLLEDYAGICGISEAELLQNYQPEIKLLAAKQKTSCEETLLELKKRYDGYHFCEDTEGMYNPWSLLNTFLARKYKYYWFEIGTPTFLTKMLTKTDLIPKLEDSINCPQASLMDYRVEYENPVPLLYQTGYLTIKSFNTEYNEYILGFPNDEVKYGFLNELLPVLVPHQFTQSEFYVTNYVKDLKAGNLEAFMNRIKAFFAGISNKLNNKTEKDYQTTFFVLVKLIGQFVRAEEDSAIGRSDIVIETTDSVYCFEFKMDENATAEDALAQIDSKNYLLPYSAGDKKLVKVGVEFSNKTRTIERWLVISG
jgi:hypothetical protein